MTAIEIKSANRDGRLDRAWALLGSRSTLRDAITAARRELRHRPPGTQARCLRVTPGCGRAGRVVVWTSVRTSPTVRS